MQRIAAAARRRAGAPRAPAAAAAAGGGGRRREAVDFDPEVAAIFTDEATELIEASERALARLAQPADEPGPAPGPKRPLHTLKGGARMAGIMAMGDLSHELESLVMLVDERHGDRGCGAALMPSRRASMNWRACASR